MNSEQTGFKGWFMRLSVPARILLAAGLLSVLCDGRSALPKSHYPYPLLLALLSFGSLQFFRWTGKRIFKKLYMPILVIGSVYYFNRLAPEVSTANKWLTLVHFICLFLTAASALVLYRTWLDRLEHSER